MTTGATTTNKVVDLRAASYESLIAASALFEIRCKKERKAFCECKKKYMAPKKCLAQAEKLHDAHTVQMSRLKASNCHQSYLDLQTCLEEGQRSYRECMEQQRVFRDCVEREL